ncbi:MAG TPA: hypothetical protein VIX58_00005, partial [Anaerolineae bacterium]
MKTRFLLALILALVLALGATPAFAQTNNAGDRVCFGGNIDVRAGDSLRDIVGFGCNIKVQPGGNVQRDVVMFGGNVDIASTVGRDVFVIGGNLQLRSTAVVGRDAVIIGGGLDRAEGARVGRNLTTQNDGGIIIPSVSPIAPVVIAPSSPGSFLVSAGLGLVQSLFIAIAFAALGVLLAVFFPNPLQRVMTTTQQSFWPSAGVGCLTLLVTPMLLIFLLLTLIGPLLYIIALIVAWVFGWTAVGYLAGERILQALKVNNITSVLAVLVGVLVLALVSAVPCLGAIVWLLIGTLG